MKIAIVGAGVIGGGWASRFLLNGHDVSVFEPSDQTYQNLPKIIERAAVSYGQLGVGTATRGSLTRCATLEEAVADAVLVQESVPEILDLKRSLLNAIDAATTPATLICSSTSGLLPTALQAEMAHPERLVVGHPFNPVYLLPLVEIVGGDKTSAATIEKAREIYASVGMRPLHVRKEIDAFIADRLLEAVWREALWLVHDGIATTEEIDDSIKYGFGLRWAQMGMFETYRIAGGPAGMRHFMKQFGPALEWPWSKLTDVVPFTDELVDLIANQSDEQAGGVSIEQMETDRDANLVAILSALRERDWGAGKLFPKN